MTVRLETWFGLDSEYRIRGSTVGERRCYKGVVGTRSHVQGMHFIFVKSAHEGIDFQLVLGKTSSGLKRSQDLRKSIGYAYSKCRPRESRAYRPAIVASLFIVATVVIVNKVETSRKKLRIGRAILPCRAAKLVWKNCSAAGNPSLYKFLDEVFEQNFDRREILATSLVAAPYLLIRNYYHKHKKVAPISKGAYALHDFLMLWGLED
ncbi:hypothetical protein ACOSQ2_028509 [Xanthoceras sorbifolium]